MAYDCRYKSCRTSDAKRCLKLQYQATNCLELWHDAMMCMCSCHTNQPVPNADELTYLAKTSSALATQEIMNARGTRMG